MDELDARMLAMLKKDGRMTFVKIAAMTGLTEGAVRARIKKLMREGVIKRFTIDVRDEIRAVVFVAISRSFPTTEIADRIRKLGIEKVYEVSGNYDIICFVSEEQVNNVNGLVEKIRGIDGVTDTYTNMVLK
ncbi:MAG: Lrp/AsnC family transcriptional regulator [Candidatus Marsarchaeota archaeon]|jgi:Transcriptional regulators|nr:Lrp/AsnC family transcriptional regulator [Candidatus Marsarchaeota archaeon]